MLNTLLFTAFLFLFLTPFFLYIYKTLLILTGFNAKNLCSQLFIARREFHAIVRHDFTSFFSKLTKNTFRPSDLSVTSGLFFLIKSKAYFHQGLGAILRLPSSKPYISKPKPLLPQKSEYRDTCRQNFSNLHTLFAPKLHTKAVMVIHRGQNIYERYGPGIGPDTPLLGWSMTKSWVNALVGILEYEGRLSLDDSHLAPEWAKDQRKHLTVRHLLQMNSGLDWSEEYHRYSDVTNMLYLQHDMFGYALSSTLSEPIGKKWRYSSGTTNLLCGILKSYFATEKEYLRFPYESFASALNMKHFFLETDRRKTFVGSSYGWASLRDWTNFAQLYLQNGRWNGKPLFSDYWVNFSLQPSYGSLGTYGAHFWLNKKSSSAGKSIPNIPEDCFIAQGFQGQRIFIVPSLELIALRFGTTPSQSFDNQDFLERIINSINI